MKIAGQHCPRGGAWEWGFRRFRAAPFVMLPTPYIYGIEKIGHPPDYEGPTRAWDFGVQWGFWGVSFGNHWRGYHR